MIAPPAHLIRHVSLPTNDTELEIGTRVYCTFPGNLKTDNFAGKIVGAGYRADQWRVQPEGTEKSEIINICFIRVIEGEKAA